MPRVLSAGDREPQSLTYGCFDRTYWAWKFTDFAGSRFQESVYALAHLHAADGSPYRDRLLPWISAGFAFWCGLQNSDGSFDEAYPFEHSLAATAFTSFYLAEAFRLVGHELPAQLAGKITHSFVRAGDWLCRNDERHGILSNHLAAAAAAAANIALITGNDRYLVRAMHFRARILERQSPEGWYEEYGGADPGYQTHGTFYLARLWQMTSDDELLDSLHRSAAFLTHFVHPNGTIGGEYGSRNTEFYFPAGFEMLAPHCRHAAAIAGFMRPAVFNSAHAGLATMDRYNLLPMLNNYLFAADAASDISSPTASRELLPCESEGEWHFPDAGILVRSTPTYFAICGLSKGGVLKAYDRRTRKLALSDCGYWTVTGGRRSSSQGLNRTPTWILDPGRVEISAAFVQVNQRVMTPWLFIAFRAFSTTLGRMRPVAYWIKNLLVRVLVARKRPVALTLRRQIEFDAHRITVHDTLTNALQLKVEAVFLVRKFSAIHMGSARYFQTEELEPEQLALPDEAAGLLTRGKQLQRSQYWSFE